MTLSKHTTQAIREAVGVFIDVGQLQVATQELEKLGISEDSLGLLAGEKTILERLGDLYERADINEESDSGPKTAFVRKDTNGSSFRSFSGGLVFTGASSAMGVAVVSTGIFGGAMLAAVTGGLAVVTVGALVGSAIHQSAADFLEEQVSEGHVLLFVRLDDPALEENVLSILNRYSSAEVKLYEVGVDGQGNAEDVSETRTEDALG